MLAVLIFSTTSLSIQLDLKDVDLKDVIAPIRIAIMLNTFAIFLLTVPTFSLFAIILDKRIKERLKHAEDENKEGQ
jgi:hypothetical protein